MAVTVNVRVGVGAWEASTQIQLIACPHVGDQITVGEDVVVCESVLIGKNGVWIREHRRFVSEHDAKELERSWGAKR